MPHKPTDAEMEERVRQLEADSFDCRCVEHGLEESEKKYRSLFVNARVALFRINLDGNQLEVNRRFAEILGYANVDECIADFSIGNKWNDAVWFKELLPVIREKGFIEDYETEIVQKDGTSIWILFSATIFPQQGFLEGSFVEITDRKRMEEALKRSEAMQRKMVANIGDVIVIIDQNGINRYKSPNIEKMFGWKPEEVVGTSTWDNIHPEDLPSSHRFFEALMQEPNSVGTLECRYQCKDGSYCWIEFTGSNLLHDPDIQGILGNYHNVMERRQSEQELRESEERFKALHDASFGGIAIHDKGVILECNQGLAEMTGYAVDELIGMNGLLLIAERFREMVMNNILACYEKPYEAFGLRKDGTEFPMRLEARNVPYKGKNVRTVEFRDITESKRAEEEHKRLQDRLTQAQKMESVGRLAGGVAHDFNNMLSVVIGYTELALKAVAPSEALHHHLREILKASQRSSEITRQLLAFARKQTIAPKVLDVNESVESMLKMLRHLIGEDIDIAWRPQSQLWPVKIDPTQIEQILANLCINARDAINGVGKVTIETKIATFDETYCADHTGFSPGEYVMLAISDDGCGIDQETLDSIFEPFFTTKEINQGTGLGLATVYGIVKQNNGFINVYSEPMNGTTFRIYLPRHVGEVEKIRVASVVDIPPSRGELVLLVEDDATIREMSQIMLDKLGYQVLPADTPEAAMRLAAEHKGEIHLLITDVVMPGMNGRELANRLHTLYPDIKTLFMSGYTADIIAHRGVLEEEVQFLQKPFSMKSIAAKVRQVLDKSV